MTSTVHCPAANKQGLRAQRQDCGDCIRMPFSSLLWLLLIRLLPCSWNTDSALLLARNEDKEPPLRPRASHSCKQAGEDFMGTADRDQVTTGGIHYSHKHPSYTSNFLFPILPLLGPCLTDSWGKCKIKQ